MLTGCKSLSCISHSHFLTGRALPITFLLRRLSPVLSVSPEYKNRRALVRADAKGILPAVPLQPHRLLWPYGNETAHSRCHSGTETCSQRLLHCSLALGARLRASECQAGAQRPAFRACPMPSEGLPRPREGDSARVCLLQLPQWSSGLPNRQCRSRCCRTERIGPTCSASTLVSCVEHVRLPGSEENLKPNQSLINPMRVCDPCTSWEIC